MISKETFRFLQQLKLNNDKVWFDANRSLYARLRKEFEDFLEIVISINCINFHPISFEKTIIFSNFECIYIKC